MAASGNKPEGRQMKSNAILMQAINGIKENAVNIIA